MGFLGIGRRGVFLRGVSGEGYISEDIYAIKGSALLVVPIMTSTSLRSKFWHYQLVDSDISWFCLLQYFFDSFVTNDHSCQALPSLRMCTI